MENKLFKIGLRSTFIYQGTSTRRQRRYFFGFRVKLSLVTTMQSHHSKGEEIPLSALPKDTQPNLPA